MPLLTSMFQSWPTKRTIKLEKILRGQDNFIKTFRRETEEEACLRIFWTLASHFKSAVIVTLSSLMHVTEIFGGLKKTRFLGFVKEGGD